MTFAQCEIERLLIEIEVRTRVSLFAPPPGKYRGHGRATAYRSGYENGWRGRRAAPNPYTREYQREAWHNGYVQGERDAQITITEIATRKRK